MLVEKYIGVDQALYKLIKKLGTIRSVCLIGDYVRGNGLGIIDISVFVKVNKLKLGRIS
tara:strand:- start:109 stop:285 length:177 start_codon:yes stop_codon:yes gene_type:complete